MMVRVLVIDDDRDLAECISDLLVLNGIDVVGIGYNGMDAVDLYRKFRPDIVILDMEMPRYDGVYAIKKIKEKDPDASIIVLTGYTDYKFQRDDVLTILTKSCKMNNLVEKIKIFAPPAIEYMYVQQSCC